MESRVGKKVPWDQAYKEIIEGGNLSGEGNVEGLRAVRDLQTPIDPDAPELGPKANQFVFLAGPIENARAELTKRFINNAYGTINWFEHTTVCEQSHHIATSFTFATKGHMKPDFENARFIINFGANWGEANFPMNGLSRKLANFRVKGGQLVTVDPRFSVAASHSDEWLPILPGTDAALALGMAQWIIDNKRYDKSFLELPSNPDVTYLEQLCAQATAPTILGMVAEVRQPMTHALSQAKVVENMMIDIAKKMDLPGFGDNGFG